MTLQCWVNQKTHFDTHHTHIHTLPCGAQTHTPMPGSRSVLREVVHFADSPGTCAWKQQETKRERKERSERMKNKCIIPLTPISLVFQAIPNHLGSFNSVSYFFIHLFNYPFVTLIISFIQELLTEDLLLTRNLSNRIQACWGKQERKVPVIIEYVVHNTGGNKYIK